MRVYVGHVAMKDPGIGIKHQGKKITVTLPHGQLVKAGDRVPIEFAFLIPFFQLADKGCNQKYKSKPIFTLGPKPGPIDRAPQLQSSAFETGFLPDLSSHAANNVLARLHLAAQAVVFAEMLIRLPGIPMHQQGLGTIGGNNITKRANDRSEERRVGKECR